MEGIKLKNKKYLSEEDFLKISMELQKNRIKRIYNKDKYFHELPYASETPQTENLVHNSQNVAIGLAAESSLYFSIFLNYFYILKRYPDQVCMYRYLRNFPLCFTFLTGAAYIFRYLFRYNNPLNRDEFETVSDDELLYRALQRHTDTFDTIEAILDLKEKYSLYELQQLKNEEMKRNISIIQKNYNHFRKSNLNH